MPVVVDASVALKWVISEADTEDALGLWDRWQESAERVIAPPIFKPEVTNALHQGVRRRFLSRRDAIEGIRLLTAAVDIVEPTSLYRRALILAGELALGSTYDALYLSLAESEGCDIWTADQRMYRLVHERFARVRLLTGRR